MKAYHNERLSGEPIITSVATSDWRTGEHTAASADEINALLDEANEPCYLILDVQEVTMSLDELIQWASFAARKSGVNLHHPHMKAVLAVTKSKLFELAGKGLRHDAFGNVNVHIFGSMEEALAYARAQPA